MPRETSRYPSQCSDKTAVASHMCRSCAMKLRCLQAPQKESFRYLYVHVCSDKTAVVLKMYTFCTMIILLSGTADRVIQVCTSNVLVRAPVC
jgi:hypothetical protein